jgi:cytochrome c553
MPIRYRLVLLQAALLILTTVHGVARAATEIAPVSVRTVEDSMHERLQACVACHGQNGRGVDKAYFPRLAGKPAGYLYNQLVAFRNGSRKYAPMNYLLAYLPDPYLQQIAGYFAAQDVPAPGSPASDTSAPSATTAASAQLRATGDQIVHAGVGAKGVPACVACHGTDLGGRAPGIPGLLGLSADYISAQLGGWRYGTRTAIAPDCMQHVASNLTETQVAAVSAWLAARPVPPIDRSAMTSAPDAARARLPLACGSQK